MRFLRGAELGRAAPTRALMACGMSPRIHELDRKWRVPKQMLGRRLSQVEAKRLLARLGQSQR